MTHKNTHKLDTCMNFMIYGISLHYVPTPQAPSLPHHVLLRELWLEDNSLTSAASICHSWLPLLQTMSLCGNWLGTISADNGCFITRYTYMHSHVHSTHFLGVFMVHVLQLFVVCYSSPYINDLYISVNELQ